MWPFTEFGGRVQDGPRHSHTLEEEAPEGAVTRPLFWLGSVLMGGASGQDPNAQRAPLF